MELKKSKCLLDAKNILKSKGVETLRDCEHILASVMGVSVIELNTIDELTKKQAKAFAKLIKARSRHVPLDKIIGYTDFLSLRIPFNKNTLTPRQETEILVDMIIKDIKGSSPDVLDMCSGSGCIGLAIAKETSSNVTLCDVSKKAIKISKKNAQVNQVKVNFILSNMFKNIPSRYDIIVSNPPYINKSDLEKLEIEVRDFDPRLALVGGFDGLDFYRIIAKEGAEYLKPNGVIYLEIGINQSKEIVDALQENFVDIKVIKDYSGIERFISAKKREDNVK